MSKNMITYNLVVMLDGDMLYESSQCESAEELMPLYDIMREIYRGLGCFVAILRNEIYIERITRS